MYPEIEVAKWDSEFFRYKVGRVDLPTSCAPESVERFADALVRQAHEQKFRLVYVFVGSPLESQSLSNLARRGFRDVGGKREYAREPVCISLPEDGSSEIVICREVSPSIVNLALQSSALSRFRLDPGFAENEYERLYTEWICKAVEGVDGLCAYIIGAVDEPKGLITLDSAGGEARIGLLAVDGRSRRHGVGRKLVAHALSVSSGKGFRGLHVSTQSGNQAACALYEGCGFSLISETAIFHLWVDNRHETL